MDYKKIFLVLMFLLNISFISADSDGVWHEAEDVVGGIFANDQDVKDFTFPGLVTFQSNTFFDGNVGVGTYTPSSKLDIVGNINVSTIYDRENNAFYINPGSISNMNEIRADIFKDRNDVNYYLDPASSSRLNSLVLGSGSDASLDILGGGWYNGCNGDECKNILDIDLRNGFESELRVRNS